jgi:hypothetical protein
MTRQYPFSTSLAGFGILAVLVALLFPLVFFRYPVPLFIFVAIKH